MDLRMFSPWVTVSGGRGFPCDVLAVKNEDRSAIGFYNSHTLRKIHLYQSQMIIGIDLEEDEEFQVPDCHKEIKNVEALVESCRKELESNNLQAIPYFNEILNRELDAIVDILKIDHFHASARSARTALELTVVNLYRYFYPGESLLDMSFWEKYGLKSLSHKTKSPLLELVRDGVLREDEFYRFCESYKALSGYVHYRVTYELCHTLPKKIKSEQYYAEVVRLAGKKGRIARIVKATLIKYSLEPALEVLLVLLRDYKRIKSKF